MPREVVLRYQAPEPQPIVLRYVAPKPLPGRRRPVPPPPEPECADTEDEPEEAAANHSRTGLRIFLICAAALLITLCVLGVRSARRAAQNHAQPQESFRFETERHNSAFDYVPAETTIERYPNSSGVRLRCAEEHGDELTIQEIYERVNPCTVTVATAMPDGSAIIGTGVIFTPDGYIVTNAHVVAGGTQCYAVLDNGYSFAAKLVGYDTEQDLAVIKIKAQNLPTAEFGNSDELTVGDPVYAIGNPLGVQLRGTLTDGIVSAINRDVTVDGIRLTLIQTNAALNSGNSGGPLINVYGQVIGINTMKMGAGGRINVEGLGFAIPVSFAAWMVDDLIEYGELHGEPVLGATILRDAVTLPGGETALQIYEVTPHGAADDAGLIPGDLIVTADGEPLDDINDLLRVRRRHRAGETLTLEVEHNGERSAMGIILKENTEK